MPNLSRSIVAIAVLAMASGQIEPGPQAQEASAANPQPAPVASPLTLQDAIRLGLSHNAALAAGRAEAVAAEADFEASRAALWPRLLTEAGWHRTDHQVLVFGDKLTAAEFTPADFAIDTLNHPTPVSHGVAAVALELPLYTSGRIRSGIEATAETRLAAAAR